MTDCRALLCIASLVALIAAASSVRATTLSIRARNDVPGPVQVLVEGADTSGTVVFSQTVTWTGDDNSYETKSIASVSDAVRALRFTYSGDVKHSFGVYAAEPPERPFAWQSPQQEFDALPRRRAAERHRGPAEIEAWTVTYAGDGSPEAAIVSALTPEGDRAFAKSAERALIDALLASDDAVGRSVEIDAARLVAVR